MTINFSENQKVAIEQATTLFNGNKSGIFVICGYAGAGKTTILQEIVHLGGVAKVLAPTNRAVKVLQQKLGEKEKGLGATIHSFFFSNKVFENNKSLRGLGIIVDESSMLNNDMLNGIEYGIRQYGWKVLLVGDGAQLPPIEKPGVKSRNFLSRGYKQVELTEVFRQKDGDLLDFVTRVRLQHLTGVDKESEHVKVVNQAAAIEMFLADYKAGIPVISLAWRNATRLQLNQKLISALNITKYNDSRYQYLAVNNTANYKNGETFFFNNAKVVAEGDVILRIEGMASPFKKDDVVTAPPRTIKAKAVFLQEGDARYILLPKCAEPTVSTGNIIGNTIPSQLWKEWTTTEVSAKGVTYHNLKDDIVVCEPGLVLTVHKAQGSQWKKVYVLESAYNDTNWFYTACTRAEQEVVVVGKTAAKIPATKPVQTTAATKSIPATTTAKITATENVCGSKNAPVGYYTGVKTAEELQGAEIVFYTSSFTQLKKLSVEERVSAFAVSGGLPKEPELSWVKRISAINPAAQALIPDWNTIKPYRDNPSRIAEKQYIQKFMKQLEKVSPLDVIEDGLILACYEPINKFCHRHLIAKWAEDWGRAHGVKIVYAGEYGDSNVVRSAEKTEQPAAQEQTVEKPKAAVQEQKAEPKATQEQTVSVDKRFAGIICQFTEEQIAQYADRVLEVAKTVKEKSGNGDSEFTDLVLSFTVEQIQGCADLIAQAAKQFA